ncbi:hypothetical protein RUM43_015115 [Polyplax serrata]|uniref:Uncharacterized protein n=1 Tax=Polyplax serrata TaxID=468196 RepID=A0AAN8S6N0_POLSC
MPDTERTRWDGSPILGDSNPLKNLGGPLSPCVGSGERLDAIIACIPRALVGARPTLRKH